MAEQAALKFAEEHKIDLVTLHPGLVLGALLQPVLNASSKVMLDLIKTGKLIVSSNFEIQLFNLTCPESFLCRRDIYACFLIVPTSKR